ncbi:glutamate racemase [Thalassotalea sp. PS06]|uniref:glutamate racemase n=1 Tax=Thalassotalea sp. PS06 TaxID=2594005 RepID=UPI0011649BF8|nr:glutamate racemase [Thalassotalea sp. PS06]QDP01088.1 glutamate racemase [Thalassotalea sp. PS06]
MNKSSPIGIFDSGLGGLSICRAIRDLMPDEDILYFADTANNPYGNKPDDFLLQRCEQIVEFFQQHNCKAIVVACNTATVHTIAKLRSRFAIPLIGVEPGIKPAAKATKTGRIGVLATQQTLQSESFTRLQHEECSGVDVVGQACPDFVSLVEQGVINDARAADAVKRYVQPLLEQQCDQLVLGCTHFSFLSEPIKNLVGNQASIVDTALAVAQQVRRRLIYAKLEKEISERPSLSLFTSGKVESSELAIASCWPKYTGTLQQIAL